MMLRLYKCEDCKKEKKHYFVDSESTRELKCGVCGSLNYKSKIGKFQMNVNYKTMEEIMENEIDPAVDEMYRKIGTEMVNGDVATLENLVGEQKMKETFHEEDKWLDEKDYEG